VVVGRKVGDRVGVVPRPRRGNAPAAAAGQVVEVVLV
jgi:hypothetical protein